MYVLTFVGIFGLTTLVLFGLFSKKDQYPPGPKPHPLVGHTFQVPAIKTWRYFENLARQYGPIFRLTMAGQDMVVLTKPEDAEELLGRRSHNYSSRPPLIYAGKYQSSNKRITLMPYGDKLKKQRTAYHQMLQPRVVGGYEGIQELEALQLLSDVITRPKELRRHYQRFAAGLVFSLTYGKRLTDDNDADFVSVIHILEDFVNGTYPGAHLVDSFPILDCLPDFLSPWRVEARRKHDFEMKLYSRLVLDVKARMDGGDIGIECFAARLWDQNEKTGLDLEELSYAAGTAFEAGTDTTSGTLHWFFLAIILYPEAMEKAHAELDTVLGDRGDTIPGFAHLDNLPYCVALSKEVIRWGPVAPGGFPHLSDQDDEYKGYKINGRTMVIPNIWSMHHNEDIYPEANKFYPDRFMSQGNGNANAADSMTEGHYGFGFGRRKCPGQHLASKSVWIAVTRLLWAFTFEPELDLNGVPIRPDPSDCTSGMTSHPVDFPIRVTPRSAAHMEAIKRECAAFGL